MIDLTRALATLVEPPEPAHRALWEALDIPVPCPADHTDVFVFQVFPYASVHLGAEGQLGGETLDRVAGFFRALGQAPTNESDHLAALLGAYATLLAHERDADPDDRGPWRRAREALLAEHLLPWVPAFARRVADLARPPYRAWASLVDELMAVEAARTPAAAAHLPVHLVEAPALPDPRSGAVTEFVDGLLAPVRIGMILTASDLARAADELGLGRRIGERRFVIRTLLDQDAASFLGWLADAADADAAAWDAHWLASSPIGRWWHTRATATAVLLRELVVDARALTSALPHASGEFSPHRGAD